MKQTFLLALIHYFASYTESNECFATSDEQLFHQKADAEAHAVGTLKDGQVTEFTRDHVASLAPKTESYEDKKIEALLEICTERGIEATRKMGKKKIIELLEADDKAKAEEGGEGDDEDPE